MNHAQELEEDANHPVDARLDHNSGEESGDVGGRDRMRSGKPNVQGNHTGFNSKAQKEQNKSPALLLRRKMRGRRTESRIIEALSTLGEECKSEKQTARIHVRHDQVEQSCIPAFLRAMFVGHQSI